MLSEPEYNGCCEIDCCAEYGRTPVFILRSEDDAIAWAQSVAASDDLGDWQHIDDPSQEILYSYPEGTVEVPLKSNADYNWQNGEWVHVPPPEPTPEERRAPMPDKTPREFRDILNDEGILTDAVPDEVTIKINQIPFDIERMKAPNAWNNMSVAQRGDPYIDMIGAMFGRSPEQIDILWTR